MLSLPPPAFRPLGATSVYCAMPSPSGRSSALSAGGPKIFAEFASSSILNSRRAVLRMVSLMSLKLRSSVPGHLDDDVLVAGGDGGLAKTKPVDPARDRLLRLSDGAVADLRLDVRANLERELVVARPLGLRHLPEELLREAVVDLSLVGLVLEPQADERRLRLGDVDLLVELAQLVARDAPLTRMHARTRWRAPGASRRRCGRACRGSLRRPPPCRRGECHP